MSEFTEFYNGTLGQVDGKLVQMGCKCNSCGKMSYPQTERCMFCGSDDTEKAPLLTEGTVFMFSVTKVPVGHFEPPIIGAFIDLPDGTRVYGHIHAGENEVKTGMKVRVKIGTLWTEPDGTSVQGYYYVPVNGGAEK